MPRVVTETEYTWSCDEKNCDFAGAGTKAEMKEKVDDHLLYRSDDHLLLNDEHAVTIEKTRKARIKWDW